MSSKGGLALICLAVTLTLCSVAQAQVCNSTGTCLHRGTFDPSTCKCKCPSSAYSGKFCQFVSCTSSSQPSQCAIYSVSLCKNAIVSSFCPKRCNSIACLSSSCNIDSCLNGGVFNRSTWYVKNKNKNS